MLKLISGLLLLISIAAFGCGDAGTGTAGSGGAGGNGGNVIPEYERAAAQNDFVRWYNSNRGYVSCDLTPESWTTHFRVTPFVDKPDSPIGTKASFVIERGQPGVKQA